MELLAKLIEKQAEEIDKLRQLSDIQSTLISALEWLHNPFNTQRKETEEEIKCLRERLTNL